MANMKPIPFDFMHEGIRYSGRIIPRMPPIHQGLPGWYTVEVSEGDRMRDVREITRIPEKGFGSIYQFVDQDLVDVLLDIIGAWYG